MTPAPPTQAVADELLVPIVRAERDLASLAGLTREDIAQTTRTALGHFERGELEAAGRLFELLAAAAPGFYLPFRYLGFIAQQQRRWDAALAWFQRAGTLLEGLPDRSDEEQRQVHELAYVCAEMLARLDRHGEARDCLEALQLSDKLDPSLKDQVAQRLVDLRSAKEWWR